MADGLAGSIEEGSITVDLVRRHVDDMATVSEAEMADAMRVLAFDHGLVVEASGSVGVAALRAGRIKPDQGGTTVVVLTGRNIAPDLLVRVLGG
jgi:threonine dehydratase